MTTRFFFHMTNTWNPIQLADDSQKEIHFRRRKLKKILSKIVTFPPVVHTLLLECRSCTSTPVRPQVDTRSPSSHPNTTTKSFAHPKTTTKTSAVYFGQQ